ncbi:hypothetical protein [Amycolatopsis sp. CA-230715]|uniref:hypothetical protein n=1 Tax=Amycolatopsis sp. CA-230715 TaxID=2745196 RepID=UPI001C343A19|nr:hypothetical protein [Amycolatopsis sp. CA-230715]QWF81329.1 hypothetical protein HUW46_04759 [Amycolatopsis sp. CA-230715]
MGLHDERPAKSDEAETTVVSGSAHAEPEREERPKRDVDWTKVRGQITGFLAGLVRWVGLIFAAILVLHVIFTIAGANKDNGIVSFIKEWAEPLTIGFKDLFKNDDVKLNVLINYGVAAIFWLVVSAILAKIIRRIGGSSV